MKFVIYIICGIVLMNCQNTHELLFDWNDNDSTSDQHDKIKEYIHNAIHNPGQFPGIFVDGNDGSSMSTSSSVNNNGVGYKIELQQNIKNGILHSLETIYDVNGKLKQKTIYNLHMNSPGAKPYLLQQINDNVLD